MYVCRVAGDSGGEGGGGRGVDTLVSLFRGRVFVFDFRWGIFNFIKL